MRIYRVLLSLVALLLACHPAFSGMRPGFSVDMAAWQATHIVVVMVTPDDAVFRVIESWKGDLRAGEQISVPELRPAEGAAPIAQYVPFSEPPGSWDKAAMIPREPPGARMILFLVKRTDGGPANGARLGEQSPWSAASIFVGDGFTIPTQASPDFMKASVVWIHDDGLYEFSQWMNPGPSVLFRRSTTLDELRRRARTVMDTKMRLIEALGVRSGSERAALLKPLVLSDVYRARLLAIEEMGKCGPAAVPTILSMLDDPAFTEADEESRLVLALSRAGGEAVAGELDNRLRREVAFWTATGPQLRLNWWNQDPTPHAPLRDRYGRTFHLVVALETMHYPPALATAIQLRDLWRSLPQLSDSAGLSQMTTECNKLIELLKRQTKDPADGSRRVMPDTGADAQDLD